MRTPVSSEKLVCKVELGEFIEKETTKKKFHGKEATEEVCKLTMKHLKGEVVPQTAPGEIVSEKLMFKVAAVESIAKEFLMKEFNEKEATEEVCQLIKQHFKG